MKLCGLDIETANSSSGSIGVIFQLHDALEDAGTCAKNRFSIGNSGKFYLSV